MLLEDGREKLRYPLADMNPMADAPLHELLDCYREDLEAEDLAQGIVQQLSYRYPRLDDVQIGLVVVLVDG
jgi:hypothetical protein